MLGLMPLRRRATLPDPARLAQALRAPERGARVLFFSGGSAPERTSRVLKTYTHNSRHLVTPFDSGGSSASLRSAFRMLSVGDVRNRLVALADEAEPGTAAVRRLLSHRLASDDDTNALVAAVDDLVAGRHPLVAEVPEPLRSVARSQLATLRSAAPASFDWRGASVGNLMLAGGYLSSERDLGPALSLLEGLVKARGQVRPIVTDDLHLVATLEDGRVVVGQHRITGKTTPPPGARITSLSLVRSLEDPAPAEARAAPAVTSWIEEADVICFPMGSFFTSVVANLLPRGVGRAIAAAPCPKVFVPNAGDDPEMRGMSVADAVEVLLGVVRADAGDVPAERVLDAVLLDESDARYARPVEAARIAKLGVDVIRLPLLPETLPSVGPRELSEALVSLASPP